MCGTTGTKTRPVYLNDESGEPLQINTCVFPEIDHRIALGVARRLWPKVWMRAWNVANLWVLCHDCHVVKTRSDRRIMKSLDADPSLREWHRHQFQSTMFD